MRDFRRRFADGESLTADAIFEVGNGMEELLRAWSLLAGRLCI